MNTPIMSSLADEATTVSTRLQPSNKNPVEPTPFKKKRSNSNLNPSIVVSGTQNLPSAPSMVQGYSEFSATPPTSEATEQTSLPIATGSSLTPQIPRPIRSAIKRIGSASSLRSQHKSDKDAFQELQQQHVSFAEGEQQIHSPKEPSKRPIHNRKSSKGSIQSTNTQLTGSVSLIPYLSNGIS